MVTWLSHNEERFRELGLFTQSSELELVTAFSCLRGDTKKTKLGPCCAQQENKTKSKPWVTWSKLMLPFFKQMVGQDHFQCKFHYAQNHLSWGKFQKLTVTTMGLNYSERHSQGGKLQESHKLSVTFPTWAMPAVTVLLWSGSLQPHHELRPTLYEVSQLRFYSLGKNPSLCPLVTGWCIIHFSSPEILEFGYCQKQGLHHTDTALEQSKQDAS